MAIRLALLLTSLVLAVSAQAADPRDPWERFNRGVFAFNDQLDRWVLKPVARGYRWLAPEPVDKAVTHFFANVGEVVTAANFALQGEGGRAGTASARLLVNSTLGVAGLFDVASAGGLARRETDFGVTLGKWGAGSGPYLVLPFLGPSDLRDTLALPVDRAIDPLDAPWTIVEDDATRAGLSALYVVDLRADLLRYEQAITGDRYVFFRDIYLQRRDFEVNGAPAAGRDPFLDDDVDVDFGDTEDGFAPEAPAE